MTKTIQGNFRPLEFDSIDDLRDVFGKRAGQRAVLLGYNDPGDGGGGPERIWEINGTPGHYIDNGGSVIVPDGGDGSAAWVWEWVGPIDIKWFGATSGDSTLQMNEAFAYANTLSPKGVVTAAPGTYTTGPLTLFAGVSFICPDKDSVNIVPNASGITIFPLVFSTSTGANMTLSGFNINCGALSGVTGVDAVFCNRLVIQDVGFFGCEINFEFDRGGWNKVIDCETSESSGRPSGQYICGSTDDAEYGNVFSIIENYQIRVGALGTVSPACKFRRAVAMKITNQIASSTLKLSDCVLIENDCQGLMFTDCSVVGFSIGARFQQGAGVVAEPIFNVFTNFEFDQNATNAILMDNGRNNRFHGCSITSSDVATDTQAIVLRPGSTQNRFYNCHVTGYYTSPGVGWLLDGTRANVLDSCVVSGSYTGITAQNNPSENKIINCDISQDINTFAITGDFTNQDNHIENCFGSIPIIDNIVTPIVPASTIAATNNFPVPVQIFITGGTFSNVIIRGNTLPITGDCVLTIDPTETIAITYTSAPSWSWVGKQ